MNTDGVIPLFPLRSVLFPRGRLPLQIFEKRYIDLVSRVMRSGTGFGVCLISEGDEVARAGAQQTVHRTGTYARIVDWESLPNGLLGITAEGEQKFHVRECWSEADQLLMGKVEFSPGDCVGAPVIPISGDSHGLANLLRTLMAHPVIEKLQMTVNFDDLREVGWRLSELMPIPPERKQMLLDLEDPLHRARSLEELVAMMSAQS